jgi:hypothetical protein
VEQSFFRRGGDDVARLARLVVFIAKRLQLPNVWKVIVVGHRGEADVKHNMLLVAIHGSEIMDNLSCCLC